MATVTSEVEVASSFPAGRVFKVFSDFETVAPKAGPELYKSIETIEGNGDVGTRRHFTFGDTLPFKTAKQRVDAVDPSNFSYTYTFFDGDVLMGTLDSITNHVKFIPSADGGSTFKQTIVYNCKGDAKPSEDVVNFTIEHYKRTFKSLEAYGAAHPEIY